MKRIIVCLVGVLLCAGCASVSDVSSNTWRKTKSLFGGGGDKPEGKKVTLETYPSRTTVSTLEQPKMEVKTQPTKVQVKVRTAADKVPPPSGPQEEKKPDRENLTPAERRLQEKIDRDVERLHKKHKGGGIMGILR